MPHQLARPNTSSSRPTTSSSRPSTSASLSSLPTMSSMGSSLNGAQLAALVQRRGQLRAQMQSVDRQMSRIAPSSSSAPSTAPPQSAPHMAHQPRPVGRASRPCGDTFAQLHSHRASCHAAASSTTTRRAAASQPPQPQLTLPGALQPGRYAFWPKGLAANRAPPAASRRGGVHTSTASQCVRGRAAAPTVSADSRPRVTLTPITISM